VARAAGCEKTSRPMAGHKSVQRKGRKGTQRKANPFATEYTEESGKNQTRAVSEFAAPGFLFIV
jgi:hypothetical protein